MKVSDINFKDPMQKKLQNIYIILSNESVLIEENLEKIYSKAKSENFTEKESYVIGKRTNWDFLSSAEDNLDLFTTKKVIEIKLLEQGPGGKGAKALKDYVKEPDPNILLVVIGENLDRKSYSSAWVRAIEKAGVLLSLEPLSPKRLLLWIEKKGKELDISIGMEAAHLMVEKTEGNLMSTMQEIRKLSLIYPHQEIDLDRMKENIANSSRYSIFDFSNAFVTGNSKKAIKVLESLKAEGTPETLIIWALARELNNLFKVVKTGSTKGIWGPRKYLDSLEKSSKEINEFRILKAFKKIAEIDSSIKGFINQNPWLGIRELTLTF
tara:strand:+ start:157 stop:1128 length:972 start_codon:yes stop_codon:yes gene_type:complete